MTNTRTRTRRSTAVNRHSRRAWQAFAIDQIFVAVKVAAVLIVLWWLFGHWAFGVMLLLSLVYGVVFTLVATRLGRKPAPQRRRSS